MSSISAGTTSTTGLVATSDTTGSLLLKTGASATTAVTIDTSQNVTFAAGVSTTGNQTVTGNLTTTGYVSAPNTFDFKNRIINGYMRVAQRGTSGTSGSAAPTTAPVYPCVDRFYVYATGATVTASQTTVSAINYLSIAGAASVTAVGIGQRIEAVNCYDLAGSTATLSLNISNSLLTTVTWTASYATSNDTWSAKTQIATGTFTVTSTLTNYSAQITVPSAATTGIEILLTVGAQTSGTWVIGNVQLEKGSVATSFDFRDYGRELILCQRYYQKFGSQFTGGACVGSGIALNSTSSNTYLKYTTSMRAASTTTQSGCVIQYGGGSNTTITGVNAINCGGDSVLVQYAHSGGGPSAGNAVIVVANTTAAFVDFSAEL